MRSEIDNYVVERFEIRSRLCERERNKNNYDNKFGNIIFCCLGDGLIQHRELQHVMRACMEENGMQFSEDQVEDLTMALFEDADSESRGAITYESLKNQLQKHNGLLENLSIR